MENERIVIKILNKLYLGTFLFLKVSSRKSEIIKKDSGYIYRLPYLTINGTQNVSTWSSNNKRKTEKNNLEM